MSYKKMQFSIKAKRKTGLEGMITFSHSENTSFLLVLKQTNVLSTFFSPVKRANNIYLENKLQIIKTNITSVTKLPCPLVFICRQYFKS